MFRFFDKLFQLYVIFSKQVIYLNWIQIECIQIQLNTVFDTLEQGKAKRTSFYNSHELNTWFLCRVHVCIFNENLWWVHQLGREHCINTPLCYLLFATTYIWVWQEKKWHNFFFMFCYIYMCSVVNVVKSRKSKSHIQHHNLTKRG